jgi:hypothetical protein
LTAEEGAAHGADRGKCQISSATCQQIAEPMASAMQFVPQDRGEAMIHK